MSSHPKADDREVVQAEKTRLLALRADVSTALASGQPVATVLQRCCEALVRHLDVALARIRTLNESGNVFELKASAGLYTHLNDLQGQVLADSSQMGEATGTREPHLTDDLLDDPNESDREWAAREGLVAFAGFRLAVEERVVGVAALFSHHPLPEGVVADMAPLANSIAQYLDRRRAEDALRASEALFRALFNSVDEGFCVIEMIFDAQGQAVDYRFLQVNAAFEKQSGLRGALGKRMCELAPDHEAHWFEVYGQVALTGEPIRFSNYARALQERIFDVYAFPVGEADGRKVAILFKDITEQR